MSLELVILSFVMWPIDCKVVSVTRHVNRAEVTTNPGTTDSSQRQCSECSPGSEPNCNNGLQIGNGCSVCRRGWFSPGGFESCHQCSSCPQGKGMVSPCSLTKDTECDHCREEETFSDESSQESCQLCSQCFTKPLSSCTVFKDTECSSHSCSAGQYWNGDADACITCSAATKEKPECNQPSDNLHPGITSGHHNASASQDSNVVIIVGATVGSALVVTICMVAVCLRKWRCQTQRRRLQRPQSRDRDQQQRTGEMKVLGKDSLVKELPSKSRDNLAIEFMRQGSRVYYRTIGERFSLSNEEISKLSVYCQSAQCRGFSDTFYQFLEVRKPGMTVSDLCEILADCIRPDLISELTKWVKDESVDLQISESDFNSDSDISVSCDGSLFGMILCPNPMPSWNDSDPLMDDRRRSNSVSSSGQCSPAPGTPPPQRRQ